MILLILSLLPLLLLAPPTLLLCLQIAAAPRRWLERGIPGSAPPFAARPRPPIVVLIPAHNEESGIGATLEAVQNQLGAADRLLVIADNCSDRTGGVARNAGAEVSVRQDPARRGKPFALAHGLRHLAARPVPRRPDRERASAAALSATRPASAAAPPAGAAPCPPAVLICLDADCWLGAHALDWLTARCLASGRPVQGLYLMQASSGAAPPRRAAEWAWRIKNGLRALGRDRLGMACQLTGSGMAFPSGLLSPALLEQASLVEDLALGLDLAARGSAPVFCPQALIHSRFPDNAGGARTQRTRWEHGHLQLIWRDGARHLLHSLRRRDWRYAGLALDLCVPPLSLLLLLSVAFSIAALCAWRAAPAGWPWLLPLAPSALLLAALFSAWRKAGRDLLPARVLWRALLRYVLAKLPLYLRFLVRRQREWIGSARDRPPD